MARDRFDYEEARRDLIDNGCDPDYLSYNNKAARDKYIRSCGLDPRSYGSDYEPDAGRAERKTGFWDRLFSADIEEETSRSSWDGVFSNDISEETSGSSWDAGIDESDPFDTDIDLFDSDIDPLDSDIDSFDSGIDIFGSGFGDYGDGF